MTVEHRLATYGSLAPGKLNNNQLDGLAGFWRSGKIFGRLVDAGWGSDLGFPGLVLDDQAYAIPVSVFESSDLPQHWQRLDTFEGEGYRRAPVSVTIDGEQVEAYVYTLAKIARL
jgi:gamma-glutamylcyclotransferase (GGCT)/AIG2-like uncharacterized protein YtfP